MNQTLLKVENLTKRFVENSGFLGLGKRYIHAVESVSFELKKGEVLGLVGESGSGKTTLGRCVLRLIEPSSGEIEFDGKDILNLKGKDLRWLRRKMQIVFQDPYSSLDPRKTVLKIIRQALSINNFPNSDKEVLNVLNKVGLGEEHLFRFPHEFSGGQRQRIGIARALSVNPSLIIADEPVSALDVSIQAQIINLLEDLQKNLNLSILFIGHDLSVIEYISNRVMVMYLGRVMELGSSKQIYKSPKHPYTEALLSASPILDPSKRKKRILLSGDLPSPSEPPSGCVFHTRCRYANNECKEINPTLREIEKDHFKACIRDDIL